VQMENPQLFKFQPILIFGHSTKTWDILVCF
jgi:hypothetical protein